MLPAWNVTLAEAAAGRSTSIVTDVAVTAAKRATVRITRPSLDLWSVARQGTAEPVRSARATPPGAAQTASHSIFICPRSRALMAGGGPGAKGGGKIIRD